jgi:Transposase IS4
MGRKRSSNDADLVQPDQYIVPKNKKAKIPPPDPWPLPDFDPLPIDLPYTDGEPNLPPHVDPTNPLALLLLEELAIYINEYVRLHPYREYNNKSRKVIRPRKWKPTSLRELLIFLAVTIHIGLLLERDIKEYWTTTRKKGVDYFTVRENMSKDWWQQINLKLYISFLKVPDDKTKESPFEKVATLSDTIRDYFRLYWKPGTHLAVDETIV